MTLARKEGEQCGSWPKVCRASRPAVALPIVLVLGLAADCGVARAQATAELWTMGNCNLDRRLDIADAIMMLDYLFSGSQATPCIPLCNPTGDSRFDIADAIAVLSYLFEGRPLVAVTPPREEVCDAIDNDCDGIHEEGCPDESVLLDLAWDPVTRDAEGDPEQPSTYRLYIGTRSRQYTDVRNVGATTQFQVHGLSAGVRYYIAVTAIDRAGNESGYSNEITALFAAP
jgi:hypothetical protein